MTGFLQNGKGYRKADGSERVCGLCIAPTATYTRRTYSLCTDTTDGHLAY